MPNTCASGRRHRSHCARRQGETADEKLTLTLFRGVGEALAVKDETLMDPSLVSAAAAAYLCCLLSADRRGYKKGFL
jgi:pyrroline-5-carboxylate reductase